MAYITAEETKQIRNKLKEELPNLKFSVRKGAGSYSVNVSIVKGDIDFYECANTNGSPGAESCSTCSVNHIQNSCFGGGEQGKFMMSDGKTFSEHYKFKDPIKVQTITLDDLIIQYGNPDLIKIDVEGYENKVLLGAIKTIKKYKPVIYVENNLKQGKYNTINFFKRKLSKFGYKPYIFNLEQKSFFKYNKNIIRLLKDKQDVRGKRYFSYNIYFITKKHFIIQ